MHAPARSIRSRGTTVGRSVVAAFVSVMTIMLALIFVFPFVWTVSSALKTGWEVVSFPPRLLPKVPQWGNFPEAWTTIDFSAFFRNSFIVTITSVLGQTFSSFLVSYGFARFRFPGRNILFMLCLTGMMMPVYVTIIPLFTIFHRIGWIDSLKTLIVPSFFGRAFSIFLLRQFIMTIPRDFDESALLDGASRLAILFRILLPNCQPALATVAIFAFTSTWNDFLGPLIFLDSVSKFTLPLGLWFLRAYQYDPAAEPQDHLLMAGSLITTLPVLIVFAAAQRYFVQGVVMSGIKG